MNAMSRRPKIIPIVFTILIFILLIAPLSIPIRPPEGTVPPEKLADADSRFIRLSGINIHPKLAGRGDPKLMNNLTVLRLNNNQLTAVPPQISQWTELEELALGNNQLTALPPEIWRLTTLQRLYLENTRLTTLPLEIVQLTELKELTLGDNQLTALPPEIGQLAILAE